MDERAEEDGFIEEDEAEFLEEDEVLLENAVLCPTCNEMTGHLILNEKPKAAVQTISSNVKIAVKSTRCTSDRHLLSRFHSSSPKGPLQ